MGLPSKEENILKLFFNEPTKHWHFTEILKKARISRPQANNWLKKFQKEQIITHIDPPERFPYFRTAFENSSYIHKKRLFSLQELYKSGLLSHLHSLKKAKIVVIFGSFVRSDWHSESDIDILIYGDPKGLNTTAHSKKLHREIQTHIYTNKNQLKKIRSGLIKNVIEGYFVKGGVQELLEYHDEKKNRSAKRDLRKMHIRRHHKIQRKNR